MKIRFVVPTASIAATQAAPERRGHETAVEALVVKDWAIRNGHKAVGVRA